VATGSRGLGKEGVRVARFGCINLEALGGVTEALTAKKLGFLSAKSCLLNV
jgi:hypothetical protein